VSLGTEKRYDFPVNSSSCINDSDSAFSNSHGLPAVCPEISCFSLDKMMNVAYVDKLLYSDCGPQDYVWCQRWSVIIQHMGQHYSLPGGSIGKKYIDLLSDELQYLSLCTYYSECLIVFCSVILQRDHLVCKSCDIHHLLERRMNL